MEARLKTLRTVHLALLISLGLYVYVGERIQRNPKAFLQPSFFRALAALAFVVGAVVLLIRMRFIPAAEEQLQLQSTDAAALKRWNTMQILSFTLCESIALYGIVLRVMGASFYQAATFYAGGIILMLLSTPRRP